ncbi:precorrin-2 dehydrogenase/sirohydrochlorin ferrochelatase family protein [Altererythrobacter sp. CAU 1778]
MHSLPLFHRLNGQPVLVLGQGDAAEAKRQLLRRAGADILDEMQDAIDRGARLAFVAHDDAAMAEGDAIRLRCAGLLVNVVDRPELCDFTTPSILDRDPVLVAVATGGASAGLAKHLRLRLERLLPSSLGELAERLFAGRAALRARFPDGAERRRALDAALCEGGALDPFDEGSASQFDAWLHAAAMPEPQRRRIALVSTDPDDLTLRQARWLGMADVVIHDADVPETVLSRARADAIRMARGATGTEDVAGVIVELISPTR